MARSSFTGRNLLAEWKHEQDISTKKRKSSLDNHGEEIQKYLWQKVAQKPTKESCQQIKTFLDEVVGAPVAKCIASLTVSIGDVGAAQAKKKGDPDELATLSAIQGTYHLVDYHAGSPCFKQEPGPYPADSELLLVYIGHDQRAGWYILDQYPVDKQEINDKYL